MNKKYWEDYYSEKLGLQQPSSYSLEVINFIRQGESILELGCGNGRDSFYFANNGIRVIAVDQSKNIINRIKKENVNPTFLCMDIADIQENFNYKVNHCYARFFFHALDNDEENSAIKLITNILPKNGYFFSESRSIKSSLYGKGEFFSKDIYSTNHKRRFIRKDNFIEKLKHNGFQIESIIESDGLAIFENDDPVVIRICAKKTEN